ncbi:microtubule-associated protein futsch [Conger conger]|uniref:microtubule-associated protein futsch n=1 Tax=Conger conger TaxID=82655 RepID=UPI002A5A6C20|nr:microtubule-associated protein futsch [Conger conger]
MASLCRRQQCTIERRGFRQELDSWRHKLIHCVGFESILQGLFGRGLVDDLTLFKDSEPEDVSDWSFNKRCLFCCLRRQKVQEHLLGFNSQGLEGGEQSLCSQEQSKINKLEKQAEEFLNAVFCRKEIPSFSDPHIPLVAREIMQRMIRQFASEYTSKSSSSQDSLQPNGTEDQNLPQAPSAGPVPAASAQNPVLSQLLMADQDSPLDLTIRKPEAEPSEQDGVLDLSFKKSRASGSLSHRNSQACPATPMKGEPLDRSLAKVQDLQSTSTMEQFMAKLCLHHQRQIVDALGFLQTEVKAVGSSCCPGPSASKASLEVTAEADCSPVPQQESPDYLSGQTAAPVSSCSARSASQSLETADLPDANKSPVQERSPETTGYTDAACESCTSLTRSDPVDLRKATPGNSRGSRLLFSSTGERENKRRDDLPSLSTKNTSSGSLAEVKKFQMLDGSRHTLVGTLDERQCNPETLLHPVRDDLSPEELSLSIGSHDQLFDHPYHTEQRASSGITKDLFVSPCPAKKTTKASSPASPRTARKSSRGTYPRPNHSVCPIINDPDIHCDIVYISKPITEYELQPPNRICPRRNARKSTRGYAYMEEICELKTVRTLAGKPGTNNKGNCPAPVLQTTTTVTPKQALSMPESVPPVDIPFAGDCGETVGQKEQKDLAGHDVMAGDDVAAVREADLIVETSQTGQPPLREKTPPPLRDQTPPPLRDQSAPPLRDQTPPPLRDQTPPPLRDQTPPPLSDQTAPPLRDQTPPPLRDQTPPPLREKTPPPLRDQTAPPLREKTPPPLRDQTAPPLKDQTAPPLKDQTAPPLKDQTAPPLKDQTAPPLKDQTAPPLSPSVNQEITEMVTEKEQEKSEAEEIVGGQDGQPDVEVRQTLLPQGDSPVDAAAAASDEIATEGEAKNCFGELQSSSRLTRVLPTEDSVKSESIGASRDLSKQDQGPEDPEAPVAEDQEQPMLPSEKETLPEIEEEHLEKVHLEEQQTISIDLVSGTAKGMVSEDSGREAVGEIFQIEAVKESAVEVKHLKHTENEGSEPEAAVIPSEITVPKRVSGRDIAPSDRCLRKRPQPVSSESTKIPKTNQAMPSLLQIQDSPVDPLKISGPTRPHRSVRVKQPAPLTLSDTTLQNTEEKPVDKPQLSSEVRPNTGQAGDNMVQTRHKAMLAKQLGNEVGSQCSKAAPAPTAGPSTGIVGLVMPNQLAHLKEKLTKNTSVESNIPGDCSMSSENTMDTCRKMPLTRERSKVGMSSKPMRSATLMKHKKLVLRSQRCATLAAAGTKAAAEQDQADPDIKAGTEKVSSSQPAQKRDLDPFGLQKLNLSVPNPPKFLEALRGEENQLQIMSLNTKYDKMQRGWVQLDKEGQPAQRPKNKADRLKEIWKSKRRVRKPKPLDQQRYSPVQMLFMKTFDLTSICRWFLQSTETKSLVIVKKVNTRLPSETQLCFHSSSAMAGSSHGVFPSMQAERLKKHLKKFAVASPVKSNAKNQKLIAKALEQEAICSKGKDKLKELTSATRISTKPYSNFRKLEVRAAESQKATATIKSPATARILRKYTNIREKLHVQQHALKPKIAVEDLKGNCVKPLLSPKLVSKPKALPENRKRAVHAGENAGKERCTGKNVKVNSPSSKRDTLKKAVKEKGAKSSRKSSQVLSKNVRKVLKRAPLVSSAASRPRKPPTRAPAASGLKRRAAVPVKASRVTREQRHGVVKAALPKARDAKLQVKTALRSKAPECETVQPLRPEALPSPSSDQVLTRSQRKMETMPPMGAASRPSLKRSQEPPPTPTKRTRTLLSK